MSFAQLTPRGQAGGPFVLARGRDLRFFEVTTFSPDTIGQIRRAEDRRSDEGVDARAYAVGEQRHLD
jgi:hypothetical protein